MTNAELARCFFPGTRKHLIVYGIQLLQSSEGEKRIKLDLIMPFSDGSLVGMPSWIGEAYDHMGKADTVERFTKFDVELEAMSLFVHVTEDADKPAQTMYNVLLSGFTMTREEQDEDEEELTDVCLKFVAKVPANPKLWGWLYPYHRCSMFVRFETTQPELTDQPKPESAQMPLVGDQFDGARRQANSKKHDKEFAGVN